jgi:predicted cupin superfamily sugar epimerase
VKHEDGRSSAHLEPVTVFATGDQGLLSEKEDAMTAPPTVDDLLAGYDWYDHPEGPKFVETHRDAHRTSGHWLFLPGVFSAFHRVLNSEELWLIHGGRLLVHVLDPDGVHRVLRLGSDLARGERPVVSVPAGWWQAAELPEGTPFAFGTNVCAPAFSFEQFVPECRAELLQDFPAHVDLIMRLTRGAG